MDKRPDFKSFKEEAMKNAKVRAEYEALRPEFELMMEFIRARKVAKLSQKALAKKLKLQQPAIARLENGGYAKTSISKLSKVASILGFSLKISLHEKKRA
ncbi:MAG: Transcriptional regulator, XRE family [candidate division TM6 bacterium GW2011_GWF2_37_49]|nr:MAG: Transcriptional regulator, XRE family [candidate division TM6 bacterium GW2011_GWF2_37_49]